MRPLCSIDFHSNNTPFSVLFHCPELLFDPFCTKQRHGTMKPCESDFLLVLSLLLMFLGTTASAQLLPENLKLSQTRLQPVVPTSVRIQAVAENDGLDLVVWGSSMRESD